VDTAGSTNEDPLPGQWWKEVVKATEAHDFNFKDFSLLVSAGMTKEKRDPLYNMDYISGLKLPHVYLFQPTAAWLEEEEPPLRYAYYYLGLY